MTSPSAIPPRRPNHRLTAANSKRRRNAVRRVQELPLRIAGPVLRPVLGEASYGDVVLSPWRMKSRRFARTSWWWTQSGGTGLRRVFFLQ